MFVTFCSEITPDDIRGSVATAGPLLFGAGVLSSVSLGKSCVGNEELWPALLALNGITGLVQVLILLSVPESPKYFIFNRIDVDAARTSLRKLRSGNEEDVETELNNIITGSMSNKHFIKCPISINNFK